MENKGIYWDICPQRRLNRETYKGRGRPKESDYYIVSGEQIRKELMVAGDQIRAQFFIHGSKPEYIVCSIGEINNKSTDGTK